MKSLIFFLKQAFPLSKKFILQGIGQGILLTAIIWYPFPVWLEQVSIPPWAIYLLLFVLLAALLAATLFGRLSARSETVGWASVGIIVSGMVLTLWKGNYFEVVAAGCLALIIYVTGFMIKQKK